MSLANSPLAASPWHEELQTALATVREAGALCRRVQAELDPGALTKADRSPVTVADFGSQALICRQLGEVFPADPVIAEEDSAELRQGAGARLLDRVVQNVQQSRPEADGDLVCQWIDRGNHAEFCPRFWTLDPIDGTKGFLRGGQYAVALALIVEGVIEVAALGCPNLGPAVGEPSGEGLVYLATRNEGTWQLPLMPLTGTAEPFQVKVNDQTDPALIRFCESVEAAHSSHDDAARLAARLRLTTEPVRLDSQTKYAVVARGEAEAYLRLPRTASYQEKIWDHAAGSLVVTAAGGRVTDIHGRDLDFTHGPHLDTNQGVIVTNGKIHDEILAAIAELGLGKG